MDGLLADDDDGAKNQFWIAGGNFDYYSDNVPLANICCYYNFNFDGCNGVGLLAFSK